MEQHTPLLERAQILFVGFLAGFLNGILYAFRHALFREVRYPRSILIYKVGNIGDIICAVPSFIAIRRSYPDATITLLTSPGAIGMVGAKDFLSGAWYFNNIISYHTEDIRNPLRRKELLVRLRGMKIDLFVQIPDDYARFRVFVRNMLFARFAGARDARGFRIRTLLNVFKNTQMDYLTVPTEVESLLQVLEKEKIVIQPKVEFDFPSVEGFGGNQFMEKIRELSRAGKTVVAMNPGAKRPANEWPIERFLEVARGLNSIHGAVIVLIGGKNDVGKANFIVQGLPKSSVVNVVGKLGVLETRALIAGCRFLVSNDTGAVHIAASAGVPVVGIYNLRSLLNRWFPYGNNHIIIVHKFLPVDYRTEKGIAESVRAVSVEEVLAACDVALKDSAK